MTYIYCDFEYNDRTVLLGCFLTDTGERLQFDFRNTEEVADFLGFVDHNRTATWCAYSAMAEMLSMLRLGASLSGMRWIDLMAEASMISGTHPVLRCRRPNLLKHLDTFCIPHSGTSHHKESMRDLILSDVEFTDQQWADIVHYCWTDVDPLPVLHEVIQGIHATLGTGYGDAAAIQRGEYLKASAILEHRTTGLPVDVPFLERIYHHKEDVKSLLAQRCNEHYGHSIYAYNHAARRWEFKFSGLQRYLESLPYHIEWERTESGRLRTDDNYLDDLIKRNPELKEFKRTRNTIAQLNGKDLLAKVRNGYVIPASVPFYTVTGRNQPMVSGGFILNMAPWLRHVIRPEPDHVLIGCDWSKQEIVIALALSRDAALANAYANGEGEDLYLALAKMAGAAPPDATKQSAKLERDAFKAVQLGLGYGMGKHTLGRHLYCQLNEGLDEPVLTREAADLKAEEIYDWHQSTFVDYWNFLRIEARNAQRGGWAKSRDDWFYFADDDTRFTQVMNFPMQSNGAVCLREAVKLLAKTDLNVVCTLHDAIYIYCHRDDAERHEAILRECMDSATRKVIGDEFKVVIETNTYTHEIGYYDARGTETLAVVRELLDRIEREGPPPAPVKPPRKSRNKLPVFADDIGGAA